MNKITNIATQLLISIPIAVILFILSFVLYARAIGSEMDLLIILVSAVLISWIIAFVVVKTIWEFITFKPALKTLKYVLIIFVIILLVVILYSYISGNLDFYIGELVTLVNFFFFPFLILYFVMHEYYLSAEEQRNFKFKKPLINGVIASVILTVVGGFLLWVDCDGLECMSAFSMPLMIVVGIILTAIFGFIASSIRKKSLSSSNNQPTSGT
ncbi:hypothetical protein ACFL3E_02135 [Patescibacteria group bacterium]